MPNHNRERLVGAASVDITPPSGCRLAGYFHKRKAAGVLDPLEMSVLTIHGGDSGLAVVSLDLIALEQKHCWLIAEAVAHASRIPPANVLVACSHTHTGPETADLLGSSAETAFINTLPAAADQAARKAMDKAQPSLLLAGRTMTHGIAFNRRYLLRDGSVRTNPGIRNPEIVRPVGPVDSELNVLAFRTRGGRIAAVVVCFALHADTTGGSMISADHPGHMRRALAHRLGEQTSVLFLQGFCGDVNHIDVHGPETQQGYEQSRKIGQRIADAAYQALSTAEEVSCEPIRTAREVVAMPLRKPTDEQVRAAKLLLSGDSFAWNAVMDPAIPNSWRSVYAQEILALAAENRTHTDAPVWAAALGCDVAIVGLPGEMFADFAIRLRAASPFRYTLPVELAGGYVGYVPTPQAFREGGYETWLARSSTAAEDAGELLFRKAKELLRSLSRG
ncbi:MAG: hypothetical protein ACUVRO_09605 [Armatimonadota bacterium]